MPQQTDVVIGGTGYMVAPGSYRRRSDGIAEGRSGRWRQTEFGGGQRRAIQLERDRQWDSRNVIACMGGTAVEPWGNWTDVTETAITNALNYPSTTRRAFSCVVSGNLYVAIGYGLYRSVSLGASSWSPLTLVYTAGSIISGLAPYGTNLVMTLGNVAASLIQYDTAAGTTSTLIAGEKGRNIINYGGQLLYKSATTTHQLRITCGGTNVDSRTLESEIIGLGFHQGRVVIATRSNLYLLGGYADTAAGKWIGNPEPLGSHGTYGDDDDFRFLVSYGDRLYTWLAGSVCEYNPSGSRQGWRALPLTGIACYGACVAAGNLVVSIVNRIGNGELWAFDGTGWWMLHNTHLHDLWPTATGGAGGVDVLTFTSGSNSASIYRLANRSLSQNSYPNSAAWYSSMIDAGERDKLKQWSRIGFSFGSPDYRGNSASANTSVTASFSYTVDNGKFWYPLGTVSFTDPTLKSREVSFNVSIGPSTFLQLQVNWIGLSDWAPPMTGVWAEFELLDVPAKRRRWSFDVLIDEPVVRRDSTAESRTARQLVGDLWTAWQNGVTVTFRDIDYDSTTTQYNARIVGISERVPRPADAAASAVSLELVQL